MNLNHHPSLASCAAGLVAYPPEPSREHLACSLPGVGKVWWQQQEDAEGVSKAALRGDWSPRTKHQVRIHWLQGVHTATDGEGKTTLLFVVADAWMKLSMLSRRRKVFGWLHSVWRPFLSFFTFFVFRFKGERIKPKRTWYSSLLCHTESNISLSEVGVWERERESVWV